MPTAIPLRCWTKPRRRLVLIGVVIAVVARVSAHPVTDHEAWPAGYSRREVGYCSGDTGHSFIDSIAACATAATALGLPDTTPQNVVGEEFPGYSWNVREQALPHGCYCYYMPRYSSMGYAYPDAEPPEAPEACELYFNADGNRQAIPGTLLMDGGVRQSICANVAEAPSATPGGCHPHWYNWSSAPTTSARCSAITIPTSCEIADECYWVTMETLMGNGESAAAAAAAAAAAGSEDSAGLEGIAIAGIVLGAICVLGCGVALVWWLSTLTREVSPNQVSPQSDADVVPNAPEKHVYPVSLSAAPRPDDCP